MLTSFTPITDPAADAIYAAASGSGEVSLGANSVLQAYLKKLFPGSSIAAGFLNAPGLAIDLGSVSFLGYVGESKPSEVSLLGFDGFAAGDINLTAGGLYLTSGGDNVPTSNTSGSYTVDRFQGGSAPLTDFANAAYSGAGSSYDASVLSFRFIAAADVESIKFTVVFGSEEYPEFQDTSYVDIAGVWFNGQSAFNNYAVIQGAGGTQFPLSVVPAATSDPRFLGNTGADLPIEYDGITLPLTISIPLAGLTADADGSYTINIGVADSGDHALDSALWISDFTASTDDIGGTFLEVYPEEGETIVAPIDVAINALLKNYSTLTGSNMKDVYKLITPDAVAIIKNTLQTIAGDYLVGWGTQALNLIIDNFFADLDLEEIMQYLQILPGSAKFKIDTNKDGVFDDSDVGFTYLGEFDVNKFSVQKVEGGISIQYVGDGVPDTRLDLAGYPWTSKSDSVGDTSNGVKLSAGATANAGRGNDVITGQGLAGLDQGAGVVIGPGATLSMSDGRDHIIGVNAVPASGLPAIINNGTVDMGATRDTVDAVAGGFAGSGLWLMGRGDDIVKGFGAGRFDGGVGQKDVLVFAPGVYSITAGSDGFFDVTSAGDVMAVKGFEFVRSTSNPSFTRAFGLGTFTVT